MKKSTVLFTDINATFPATKGAITPAWIETGHCYAVEIVIVNLSADTLTYEVQVSIDDSIVFENYDTGSVGANATVRLTYSGAVWKRMKLFGQGGASGSSAKVAIIGMVG